MRYFVTSDIHSFYDEFIKAINDKGFDLNNPNHMLIICGDLFDRGKKPQELINYILKNKDKIILIRGNHEDLMENMIERNSADIIDYRNNTYETIKLLCPNFQEDNHEPFSTIADKSHLKDVLDLTINYYETEHYVFIHGWIPVDDYFNYDPNWRDAYPYQWRNARKAYPHLMYQKGILEPNKTIVCGHYTCAVFHNLMHPETYTLFGNNDNHTPYISKDVIALDADTVISHIVNVIVLDD